MNKNLILKKKIIICKKCVLDTTVENIKFNKNGICNYCERYEKYLINETKKNKSQILEKIISKIKKKGKNKDYDAIVGLSGGVDSTYCLYKSVKEFGLKVLALHVDSGWNSEIAVSNIHNAVNILNVDLYTEVLNWNEIKDLQLSFFKASVINCDIPQDHAFKGSQYKIANKFGINYFISGRNFKIDGMLPSIWGYPNNDGDHIKDIHKNFGSIKIKNYPYFTVYYDYILKKLLGYRDIQILELINYKREEAKSEIEKNLNWRDYGGKHYESVFTEFYQSYFLPKKFNVDKRKAHLSGLILNNEITREDALIELNKPVCSNERQKVLVDYMIKKLGINDQQWQEIMKKPIVHHDNYKNSKKFYNLINYAKKILLK